MEPEEKRRYSRLKGLFHVDLLNIGDDPSVCPWTSIVPGTALDVSQEGMRLKIPYTVKVGCHLSTIVYYQGGDSVCLCEVIWKRPFPRETLYGLYIQHWSRLDGALSKKLEALPSHKAKHAPLPTNGSS